MIATPLPAETLFVSLLKDSSAQMKGLALRMMGNSAEADDVLQEAWLRAWRSRHQIQNVAALQGWMRQIVVRECLRALRWRSLRRWVPWEQGFFEAPDPTPAADIRLIQSERQQRLNEAIALLSPKQRLVFGLRFDEGWSLPEIAESCEMSTETVKTHLSRGVAAIQQKMEGR